MTATYIPTSQAAKAPDTIFWLEKASQPGRTTIQDIKGALDEYERNYHAGTISKAEMMTLHRAFPESPTYAEAAGQLQKMDMVEPLVIGGPASVELIDREGHLITAGALGRAFQKFMDNERTRNVMVLHSDVQVGWALPAYISKGGQIYKSGVDDKGLFFICELRNDTAIAKKVAEQINDGLLKSYSIAGSATKVQNMKKGMTPYMQVDEMELAEVTVCEKGVNQAANFEILKAELPQTGKVDKDQCGYRDATAPEMQMGINCGHCKYFNAEQKTCDVVVGDIQPGDYCRLFEATEDQEKPHVAVHRKIVIMRSEDNGKINFKNSFLNWMEKESKDPLKGKSFTTLENIAGREAEHHRLLQEYGFPSEPILETMRYIPVVETETDDDGKPIHLMPPWVVNEAGQDLGDKLDNDETVTFNKSIDIFEQIIQKAAKRMGKANGDAQQAGGIDAPINKPTPKTPNPDIAGQSSEGLGMGMGVNPTVGRNMGMRDPAGSMPVPDDSSNQRLPTADYHRDYVRPTLPESGPSSSRDYSTWTPPPKDDSSWQPPANESAVQRANQRQGGDVAFKPAPGFLRSPRGRAQQVGQDYYEGVKAQREQFDPNKYPPEAMRRMRQDRLGRDQQMHRMREQAQMPSSEKVDPRGAAGRPGRDKINPNIAELGEQERANVMQRIGGRRKAQGEQFREVRDRAESPLGRIQRAFRGVKREAPRKYAQAEERARGLKGNIEGGLEQIGRGYRDEADVQGPIQDPDARRASPEVADRARQAGRGMKRLKEFAGGAFKGFRNPEENVRPDLAPAEEGQQRGTGGRFRSPRPAVADERLGAGSRERGGQVGRMARQWLGRQGERAGKIGGEIARGVSSGVDDLENLREYYRPGGTRSQGGLRQQPGKSYGRAAEMEQQQGVGQGVQYHPDEHRNMSSSERHDNVRSKLDHIQDGGKLSPRDWMGVIHHLSQNDDGDRLANFTDMNFHPDEWHQPIGMAEMREHLGNKVRAHHGKHGGSGAQALRQIVDTLHNSNDNGHFIDLKRLQGEPEQAERGLMGGGQASTPSAWEQAREQTRGPGDYGRGRLPTPRRASRRGSARRPSWAQNRTPIKYAVENDMPVHKIFAKAFSLPVRS